MLLTLVWRRFSVLFPIIAHDDKLVDGELDQCRAELADHFHGKRADAGTEKSIDRLCDQAGQPEDKQIYQHHHDRIHDRASQDIVGRAEGGLALEKEIHRLRNGKGYGEGQKGAEAAGRQIVLKRSPGKGPVAVFGEDEIVALLR